MEKADDASTCKEENTTLDQLKARVIAVHKERYHLHSQEHGEFFAQLKSSIYFQMGAPVFPTTGDFVNYLYNPYGDSQITDTLPRKSLFQRFDSFVPGHSQAVAANFDTVFILTSANHDFNPARLRRYLAAARSSGADYAIVITKADLTDEMESYLDMARETAPGCAIYPISATKEWGLEQIKKYLTDGSVSVFLGSSGVGKSTLVNALAGKEIMDVNGIREDDSKGRHTTTHRQMITLENGAMILDTPGMRELGLLDAEEGVKETFKDIEALLGNCRFSDCTHQHEPGCAIKQALEEGVLNEKRWNEYQNLSREARRKSSFGKEEAMKKAARQKEISKYSRQLKKGKKMGF
ncbi:MAG: ribosome small subunit-dependent GTPase A [Clostridiales bacterium]|nr:ribosome small subunit-dependent GTPase A [Clostridiales bacterium]